MTIKVNANLFRIAAAFVSNGRDKPFYLEGVYIHPHAVQGAVMAVTDGTRMMVIHDVDGVANAKGDIVKLDKAMLSACKPAPKETGERLLVIENETQATITGAAGNLIAAQGEWKIDGTFPNYQRVVPSSVDGSGTVGAFNPAQLGDFADAAVQLGKRDASYSKGHIRVLANGVTDPALVLLGVDYAFGVLMPVRAAHCDSIPAFFKARP